MRWIGCAAVALCLASPVWGIDGAATEWITPVNLVGTDWKSFELITASDPVASLAGGGSFSWAGRASWDGAGAYQVDSDPNTLRVFVNHETTPAGMSYFDLNKANLHNWALNQASGTTWAGAGKVVTGVGDGWTSVSGDPVISRLCSGNLWEANTFGTGRGFADRLYLTGEEVGGGHFYALDPSTQIIHDAPDLGAGSWENATPIDTGRSDTVALLLSEDGGVNTVGSSPLRLYVGAKNSSGNFLQRNGLSGGTVYYWDPNGTANTDATNNGPLFDTDANSATNASGNAVTGTWVASSATAAKFSKLEDIHVNMELADSGFGREAVVASENEGGVYHVDVSGVNFIFGNLSPAQQSVVTLLFQASFDQDPNGNLSASDNLVWSPDGLVYVNEDGSSGEIWQLDPDNAVLSALNIADLNTAIASETSGIFDISALAGFTPGSIFLTNAHSSTATNNQLVLLVSPTATAVPEPIGAVCIALLATLLRRRR